VYALFVTIRIKPEYRDRYIEEALGDARGSVGDEPGCLRFDVLVDNTDPNTIYFYEIYVDEAAFQAHTKTPHMLKWRDAVQGWAETSAVRATTIYPLDEKWQKQPS
jgi:quinol monooxygenase YgiN